MDEPDQPWVAHQEGRVGMIVEVTLEARFHVVQVYSRAGKYA